MKKTALKLHRETLRNLEDRDQLGKVIGGIISTDNMECMMTRQKTWTSYQTYN